MICRPEAKTLKLDDWLRRNRVSRAEFSRRIGVTPGAVTLICRDDGAWLSRETAERIVAETGGAVTPNDFLNCALQSAKEPICRTASRRPSRPSPAARSSSSPTTTTARTRAT